VERRACYYLQNGEFDLRPPVNSYKNPLIEDQINLLTAISDYAKALSDATDPQGLSNLQSAAGSLATTTNKSATAASAPAAAKPTSSPVAANSSSASSPIIGPAITLVSKVAIDVVQLETLNEVRTIVEQMDPYLYYAQLLITTDSPKVEKILITAYTNWKNNKSCVLKTLKNSNEINVPLYSMYKDADSAALGFEQRVKALDTTKLNDTLLALAQAHHALLTNDVDFQVAIKEFSDYAADLKALGSAITPPKKKVAVN
jgi:hypothetical protein